MSDVYQFKISLKHSAPLIWRRVLVPAAMSLAQLHIAIQALFEWEQAHLYSFYHSGRSFDDEVPGTLETMLQELELKLKQTFNYVYDFGDDWIHTILLEKIIQNDGCYRLPFCLGGKRAGPPEDCGGIPGYENYMSALTDKNHQDFNQVLELMGEKYLHDDCDEDEINKRLACIQC